MGRGFQGPAAMNAQGENASFPHNAKNVDNKWALVGDDEQKYISEVVG